MLEILKIEPYQWQVIGKLFLAFVLGFLIGLEREYRQKSAGVKTFTLVCLASTLFTILSREAFQTYWIRTSYDPSRIIASILIGIGFIGAGVIFKKPDRIEGVTTAAGLWIATAVGISVGCGWYIISVVSTLLVIALLFILRKVDLWFDKFGRKRG